MTFTWYKDSTGEWNQLYIKNAPSSRDEICIWPVNKMTIADFNRQVWEVISMLNVRKIKKVSPRLIKRSLCHASYVYVSEGDGLEHCWWCKRVCKSYEGEE